jgi:hypothetical protein
VSKTTWSVSSCTVYSKVLLIYRQLSGLPNSSLRARRQDSRRGGSKADMGTAKATKLHIRSGWDHVRPPSRRMCSREHCTICAQCRPSRGDMMRGHMEHTITAEISENGIHHDDIIDLNVITLPGSSFARISGWSRADPGRLRPRNQCNLDPRLKKLCHRHTRDSIAESFLYQFREKTWRIANTRT